MKELLRKGLDGVRRGFNNSFEMSDRDSDNIVAVNDTEGGDRFDHKTTDVLDPDNYAITTEGGDIERLETESEGQNRINLTLDVETIDRNLNGSRMMNSDFRATEQLSKRKKGQEDDDPYRAKRVADCVMALILCHNVTPVIQKKKKIKYSEEDEGMYSDQEEE